MRKQAQRKTKFDASPKGAGMAFSTGAILSIVTGRMICAARGEITALLEYLQSRELPTKPELKAARAPAAEWITEQLPWTAQAAATLKKHNGGVGDWLAGQVAKHGENQRLLPMSGKADDAGGDPLEGITEQRMKAQLKKSKMSLGKATAQAAEAIDVLSAKAIFGDQDALHAINDLAVKLAMMLAAFGKESLFSKTCVVMPADRKAREAARDHAKLMPIGTSIGFPAPQSGRRRPPPADEETPTAFWREVQSFIDAVRFVMGIGARPGDFHRFQLDEQLLDRIVALPEFGSGARDEWWEVAWAIVESNLEEAVPDWLRVRAANTESGLPALIKRELRKGFEHCWPAPV
jgi:hypothetical protein